MDDSIRRRRRSTGKRLRFDVFKRDHFACQYCGAQPPDVVLVVDHITPVSAGGTSTIDNLTAACEACNAGKAHRTLGDRAVRPDADLLYLETQQEIAELQRFQVAAVERDAALAEVVDRFNNLWTDYAGTDWVPRVSVIRQLLDRYGPEITEDALVDVACKIATGYVDARGYRWVAYLHAVARTMAAEGEGD